MNPFDIINEWLEIEKQQGSPNPDNVVLATSTKGCVPHSRIVALREVNSNHLLFFTQRGKRKFTELMENPLASMTIWLAMQQREIVLDGQVKALTQDENLYYWQSLPRERQLRFSVYAPSSMQPIDSLNELENRYAELEQQYQDSPIPLSEYYCGFYFIPNTLYFYTLGKNTFSEVIKYRYQDGKWHRQLLSP